MQKLIKIRQRNRLTAMFFVFACSSAFAQQADSQRLKEQIQTLRADAGAAGCNAELDAVGGAQLLAQEPHDKGTHMVSRVLFNRVFPNINNLGDQTTAVSLFVAEPHVRFMKSLPDETAMKRAWTSFEELVRRSQETPDIRPKEIVEWRAFDKLARAYHMCTTKSARQNFEQIASEKARATMKGRAAFENDAAGLSAGALTLKCATKDYVTEDKDVETYYFLRSDGTGQIRSSGAPAKNPSGALCRSVDFKWRRLDGDRWVTAFTRTDQEPSMCGPTSGLHAGSYFVTQEAGDNRVNLVENHLNDQQIDVIAKGGKYPFLLQVNSYKCTAIRG